MIFWKIFSTEFTYLISRISTWLYFAVLLAFTIGMKLLVATGDGVSPNNTFHITGMTVIGGLIWLIVGGSVAGEAAARDVQMRIHPLIYTSPVKKINYLGGRFFAAFAVNALVILTLPLGIMLSFYLPEFIPGMEQEELLAFRPEAYLNVYFLIALPNVFVATALQFTFSALSRQVMTAYIAGLLLALFPQLVAASLTNIFGNWDFNRVLDPVGILGIVATEMATWSVSEKNYRLVEPEGMFLLNRILWFCVAAGLLIFTYFRFSFAHPVTKSWFGRFKRKSNVSAEISADTGIIRVAAISVPQVQQTFGLKTYFSQVLTIAWASFKKIATNPLGLTLVGAIAIISAAFGDLILNEQGIQLFPTTQQVLSYFTAPVSNIGSPWVLIPLLIMIFTGELIWHERDKGISDIADAAPAPDWVFLTGKFFGLSLVIVVWIAILMIGGILMQLILEADSIDIGLYLQTLFGLQLIDYLLFAILAFAVHIVVNQKHIGLMVVLLVFSFMSFPAKFGIEHNMLIYGAGPGWWHTDMRGFGPSLGPWLWFKAYWIAWALLLAVAARLLWVRGREQSLKSRFQLAQRRFTGSLVWISIIGAGLLFTLGSFIFYNTNVLNDYITESDITEWQAKYERYYGKYRNAPQPQLTATKLQVELYPERQEAEIHGTYTLVNKDSVAIDSIHIGSATGSEFTEVKFDRPAAGVVIDKELSHHIYALEQQLRPGDSLKLNFVVQYKQQGFTNNGTQSLVVEGGTYFTNFDLLPTIGYFSAREINDAVTRKKYRLTARAGMPSLYDPEARKKPMNKDQTTFEATIGTAMNEVAVAPGALQRSWTENDRQYFHYKTGSSIGGEYSLLSADYAVKESKWKDVAIKIYYHPGHDQNIDRMMKSIQASLEYYTEQFGPYPYKNFTAIERAGHGSGASADAGIIYYGEQYPLMNPDDSPAGLDLPYYIMAHELAHQWWGLARLNPAAVEGAGVLIEGLAVYSGLQVLEKTYGKDHLQKYIEYLHSSYAIPRSLASASLLQADQSFLYYRKGGLAMYALSKYVGKEKVNAAVRNILQDHEKGKLPLPTSIDLYRELQKVTPDSLNYLLKDLFKENTYWRLKTKQFTAEQNQKGNWEVALKIDAEKFVVDAAGTEKEVPMNDWLEIGMYEEGQPIYLKMHKIKSGEQIIKVTVPQKPAYGGIDPNYLMIDVRLDDNIKKLEG